MYEATLNMIHQATSQGHGNLFIILLIGILFGGIIQYTRVDKFEKIAGFSILEDTVVPKMLFLSIGIASIGLYLLQSAGLAHFHIKPVILGGLIIGGILFGASMAIFGKCPGTGPVSVAEGRIDVMVGAVGGILGGAFFSYFYEYFEPLMGPDLGKISIPALFEGHEGLVVLFFGIMATAVSIAIPLREYEDPEDAKGI